MTGLSGAILRPSAAIGKPGPSLMPLIMDGADYDRWLSAEDSPVDLLQGHAWRARDFAPPERTGAPRVGRRLVSYRPITNS